MRSILIDADAAILTSVDLDHLEYLGDTREKIGRDKADIFRAGRPAVSADPDPPATIAEEAARIGAPLTARPAATYGYEAAGAAVATTAAPAAPATACRIPRCAAPCQLANAATAIRRPRPARASGCR